MGCLGNILWFLFGGFLLGMSWIAVGLLWCITIVGIPIGVQCFKLAGLAFFPFGKSVEYSSNTFSALVNILWLLLGGLALAAEALFIGCLFCITIIGIPFGKQCFKIAKLSLMPFGNRVN